MTRSALYTGSLVHTRHDVHARRAFRYPVYMAAIDLAELPALDRELALFSHQRGNLFALHDRDYETGASGLAAGVADLATANRLPLPTTTRLVTNLRTFGYVFNPVSFFLNYDAAGALTSVIAEVNNTYGGRRCYVLGPAQRLPGTRIGFRHVRELFVSPFLHGEASYDFWFDAPLDGDRLAITMHVVPQDAEMSAGMTAGSRPGDRVFTARLDGVRTPLTDRALGRVAVRYPVMALQVVGLIHLEALKLRWLGVPYRRPPPDHRPVTLPTSIVARPVAPTSYDLTNPRIVPLPRPAPPAGSALRWAAFARLRRGWTGGRLDLVMPSGQRLRLGGIGRADATARVHDDRLFLRLLLRGELGAGESYVAGEWSSDDVVAVIRVFLRGTSARGVESALTRLGQLPTLLRHRRAANTRDGSQRNIHAHYDLGNAFYQLFLDADTLAYSCAYWSDPAMALAAAQHAKLERLCDWLALEPRDHLLEIGCGWGGMAIHAARTRGCKVTAITVSRDQHALASARVAAAGLSDRVDIQYRDYRRLPGTYDKIVSIEMLEAVGYDFLPGYFASCARVLAPGGRLALQSITMPHDRFDVYRRRVDWMQTYIFPGSLIPSVEVIQRAAAPAGFRIERKDDIGPHYVPTLRAWRDRFLEAMPSVRALGFDEPFVRTWLLYLAFSEAAFAERSLGDHQLLLVRDHGGG
ncbi:MAG: hypothetical protein H6Q90_764 [Deltaproteobacteria bacterium]|nr:hypothetical protein [Deltaproteobacteria bacterium]